MKGGEKNMNKTFLATFALVISAGILFITAPNALAYRGDENVQGPDCTPERHEAMTQAFNNNDYNAWKELMNGKGRITQVINEGNFAKFSQMHQLRLEGKTDEANQLRTELGLGLKDGSGKAQGQGYGKTNR
jgi:hypothetical protein